MIELRLIVDDLEGNAIGARLDDPYDWYGELTKDIIWDCYQKLKEALNH